MATTERSIEDRRGRPDRRVRRVSLHHPERRSGFDRRRPESGTLRSAWLRLLSAYRDSPMAIAVVVLGFVALSAADLILTLRALEAGASELNPVMAALFEVGPVPAAAFKLSIAVAVAAVLWVARRHRRVLELSLVATGLMAALLVYHLVLLA